MKNITVLDTKGHLIRFTSVFSEFNLSYTIYISNATRYSRCVINLHNIRPRSTVIVCCNFIGIPLRFRYKSLHIFLSPKITYIFIYTVLARFTLVSSSDLLRFSLGSPQALPRPSTGPSQVLLRFFLGTPQALSTFSLGFPWSLPGLLVRFPQVFLGSPQTLLRLPLGFPSVLPRLKTSSGRFLSLPFLPTNKSLHCSEVYFYKLLCVNYTNM